MLQLSGSQIILANGGSQGPIQGQVISLADGQQAILVQPEQGANSQFIQIPANMALANSSQAITIPSNGLQNVAFMVVPSNSNGLGQIQRVNLSSGNSGAGSNVASSSASSTSGGGGAVTSVNINSTATVSPSSVNANTCSPGSGGVSSSVQQSTGADTPTSEDMGEEEPLYVNAKQYNRILKRRLARAKLENEGRIPKVRVKTFLHESRHKHAMNRVRGQGGRFASGANNNSNKKGQHNQQSINQHSVDNGLHHNTDQ